MTISSILNSTFIREYANSSPRAFNQPTNIPDEIRLSLKSLKSVSSENISESVSGASNQNTDAVNYLRYQATNTVVNPELSSEIFNETRKAKTTDKPKQTTDTTAASEAPEYEIVDDGNEESYDDSLGKGFYIVQPEEDPSATNVISKSNTNPLFQKIIDTYMMSERRFVGQLTDLYF